MHFQILEWSGIIHNIFFSNYELLKNQLTLLPRTKVELARMAIATQICGAPNRKNINNEISFSCFKFKANYFLFISDNFNWNFDKLFMNSLFTFTIIRMFHVLDRMSLITWHKFDAAKCWYLHSQRRIRAELIWSLTKQSFADDINISKWLQFIFDSNDFLLSGITWCLVRVSLEI